MMPLPVGGGYPSAADTVAYLTDYERRYQLPVVRPVTVKAVRRGTSHLLAETDQGEWAARIIVSATGTWSRPYIPHYPGIGEFRGEHLHTSGYRDAESFRGRRVTDQLRVLPALF
jgi:putative flavoprotein involved in K+ transport